MKNRFYESGFFYRVIYVLCRAGDYMNFMSMQKNASTNMNRKNVSFRRMNLLSLFLNNATARSYAVYITAKAIRKIIRYSRFMSLRYQKNICVSVMYPYNIQPIMKRPRSMANVRERATESSFSLISSTISYMKYAAIAIRIIGISIIVL